MAKQLIYQWHENRKYYKSKLFLDDGTRILMPDADKSMHRVKRWGMNEASKHFECVTEYEIYDW